METEKGSKSCCLGCSPALLAIWKVRKFRCEEALARERRRNRAKKGGRWRRWPRRGVWGGNHGEFFQCKLHDVLWRTTTLQVLIRSSRILVKLGPGTHRRLLWFCYREWISDIICVSLFCNCEEDEEKVSHSLKPWACEAWQPESKAWVLVILDPWCRSIAIKKTVSGISFVAELLLLKLEQQESAMSAAWNRAWFWEGLRFELLQDHY